MPYTSQPRQWALTATARITAFSPGASPPPVLTTIRRTMVNLSYLDQCSQLEAANIMHGSHGPTPVFHASGLAPAGQLWIKNDGLTSTLYGGNKARKLEVILHHAQARAARRIVT